MRITFVQAATADSASADCRLEMPHLAGPSVERPMIDATRTSVDDHHTSFSNGQMSGHLISFDVSSASIRELARTVYDKLFAAIGEQSLYRVWNYVPRINEGEGDEENYRQFCLGRSESFESRFGETDIAYMPAGTCVGCGGDKLVVLALSGTARPEHHENPNQIPAYQYPREYGPRAPSFARASSITIGDERFRFISGTAAVIGHASVGIDNLETQLQVTADNVDTIIRETLSSPSLSGRSIASTYGTGKVYLRHATDLDETRRFIAARFPSFSDNIIYLVSDICRRELLLEIEFSFIDTLE